MATETVRRRRSLQSLQDDHDRGDTKALDDLLRAWRAIQQRPPTDKTSFFALAGYHGAPFQYRAAVDALSPVDTYVYWGGYCNHGNVLFPTWHRVYLLKLEAALQTVEPDVMLPFWDETSQQSLDNGLPAILTREKVFLDGAWIDNPLRSYQLPEAVTDNLAEDDEAYVKPKGYRTVRYPLSGLVGTAEARRTTEAHNEPYLDPEVATAKLNTNLKAWLKGPEPEQGRLRPPTTVLDDFRNCLDAPNYTVFSNTTSAAQWNLDHEGRVTSLEGPHNDIHLAVGGFDIPSSSGLQEAGIITESNGDMGENNTASMDPIFFFHHCNIDRLFWLWQQLHGQTTSLDIITGYAGTSSNDSQGPTPGVPPGTPLSLDSPLMPFLKDDFGTMYTSHDCIDIEGQLGYTYEAGSLSDHAPAARSVPHARKLLVRGINRAHFQGSFVLRALATVRDGDRETVYDLGYHSVLSRRNVSGCANCQTHLEVIAHFPLHHLPEHVRETAHYDVQIHHRDMSGAERDPQASQASLPVQHRRTVVVQD